MVAPFQDGVLDDPGEAPGWSASSASSSTFVESGACGRWYSAILRGREHEMSDEHIGAAAVPRPVELCMSAQLARHGEPSWVVIRDVQHDAALTLPAQERDDLRDAFVTGADEEIDAESSTQRIEHVIDAALLHPHFDRHRLVAPRVMAGT